MNAPQPQPVYAPPNNDAEHLRLLSIFHYVFAGLTAFFSCFAIFYVVIGVAMMNDNVPLFDAFPKEAFPVEAIPDDAAPEDAPRKGNAPNDGQGEGAQPNDAQRNDAQPNDDQPKEAAPKRGELEFPVDERRFVGMVFVGVGIVAMLFGWTTAVLLAVAGRKLAVRRGRTFCIVVAALSCFSFPLGTVLGVLTLIVLMRPSAQSLFAQPQSMQPW